ncbi:hypothetical protein OKW26_007351 [Paraburkholderia sp. 32]
MKPPSTASVNSAGQTAVAEHVDGQDRGRAALFPFPQRDGRRDGEPEQRERAQRDAVLRQQFDEQLQ